MEVTQKSNAQVMLKFEDTNGNGKLDIGEKFKRVTIFDYDDDRKFDDFEETSGTFQGSVFKSSTPSILGEDNLKPCSGQHPHVAVPGRPPAQTSQLSEFDKKFNAMLEQINTTAKRWAEQCPGLAPVIMLFAEHLTDIMNKMKPFLEQRYQTGQPQQTPTQQPSLSSAQSGSSAAPTETFEPELPPAAHPSSPAHQVPENISSELSQSNLTEDTFKPDEYTTARWESPEVLAKMQSFGTGIIEIDAHLRRYKCTAVQYNKDVSKPAFPYGWSNLAEKNDKLRAMIGKSVAKDATIYVKHDGHHYRIAIVEPVSDGKYNVRYITLDKKVEIGNNEQDTNLTKFLPADEVNKTLTAENASKVHYDEEQTEKYLKNLNNPTINDLLKDSKYTVTVTPKKHAEDEDKFVTQLMKDGFVMQGSNSNVLKKDGDKGEIRLAILEKDDGKYYIRYITVDKKEEPKGK